MPIDVDIHDANTVQLYCIATITDGGVVIVNRKNIGLTVDGNGDANTAYIIETANRIVFAHRNRANTFSVTVDGT